MYGDGAYVRFGPSCTQSVITRAHTATDYGELVSVRTRTVVSDSACMSGYAQLPTTVR